MHTHNTLKAKQNNGIYHGNERYVRENWRRKISMYMLNGERERERRLRKKTCVSERKTTNNIKEWQNESNEFFNNKKIPGEKSHNDTRTHTHTHTYVRIHIINDTCQ